jgi:hypothetical protein
MTIAHSTMQVMERIFIIAVKQFDGDDVKNADLFADFRLIRC